MHLCHLYNRQNQYLESKAMLWGCTKCKYQHSNIFSEIHGMGTRNACTKLHCQTLNSSWDNSVWTKVLDQQTDTWQMLKLKLKLSSLSKADCNLEKAWLLLEPMPCKRLSIAYSVNNKKPNTDPSGTHLSGDLIWNHRDQLSVYLNTMIWIILFNIMLWSTVLKTLDKSRKSALNAAQIMLC